MQIGAWDNTAFMETFIWTFIFLDFMNSSTFLKFNICLICVRALKFTLPCFSPPQNGEPIETTKVMMLLAASASGLTMVVSTRVRTTCLTMARQIALRRTGSGYYHYDTGSNETYEETLPKVKVRRNQPKEITAVVHPTFQEIAHFEGIS